MADTNENMTDEVLLRVDNLCKYFPVATNFFGKPIKFLKAVDGVSFSLKKGKTLGIVGESGCGKTTMGRTILRLYDVTKGDVYFKGQKVSDLKNRDFDKLRPNMQMIFQDPYASLSPRLTVGEIIGEAAKQHKIVEKSQYHDYVLSVMKMCGLQPHYFERYPHEFSGGQRQRICIARALALKPELVICDEPVSALDVSIQAQIINMLIELRKTLGLTYVFISHDLSVVKHISDEVGVMYLGTMVEYGDKEAIFERTLHPYTKALFSAVPVPNPHVKMNRIILRGDIPSPVNPPKGCKFHTRCESCQEICTRIAPVYKEVEPGHFCACHLFNTLEQTERLETEYDEQQRIEAEEQAKRDKRRFWEAALKKLKRTKKEEPNAEVVVTENAEVEEVKTEEVKVEEVKTEAPVEAQTVIPQPAVVISAEEAAAEEAEAIPTVSAVLGDDYEETPSEPNPLTDDEEKPEETPAEKPAEQVSAPEEKPAEATVKKPQPAPKKPASAARKPAANGAKKPAAKKPSGTAKKPVNGKGSNGKKG